MNARRFVAGALVACLGACANVPSASDFEGEEDLWVMASALKPLDPGGSRSSWSRIEPLEGVECTLRNDHGEWRATTPQRVTLRLSRQDLVADCVREGYEPLRQSFACVPPGRAIPDSQASDLAVLAVLTPLVIAAGPLGVAQLGGQVILHGGSLVHGQATAPRRDGDKCSYLAVSVQMNRLPGADP